MDDSAKEGQKFPLPYEETPIINPHTGEVVEDQQPLSESHDAASVVPEAARVFNTPAVAQASNEPVASEAEGAVQHARNEDPAALPHRDTPPQKSKRHMGTIIFIVLLFGLGVWLSGQLRSFFAPGASEEFAIPTQPPAEYQPVSGGIALNPSGSATSSARMTYQVISGTTKRPIEGVSLQLPSSIPAPTCDSGGCASSGTNLPGGTRLTIAPRGRGQLLPDFRGAILTDANGKEFVMRQTTIGGVNVYEYIGDFTGRTAGGYSFSKMRGVLIPVSDSLAIELNHFAPVGQQVDFAADDALFDSIVMSFRGGIGIQPTLRPTSVPSASGSAF